MLASQSLFELVKLWGFNRNSQEVIPSEISREAQWEERQARKKAGGRRRISLNA